MSDPEIPLEELIALAAEKHVAGEKWHRFGPIGPIDGGRRKNHPDAAERPSSGARVNRTVPGSAVSDREGRSRIFVFDQVRGP